MVLCFIEKIDVMQQEHEVVQKNISIMEDFAREHLKAPLHQVIRWHTPHAHFEWTNNHLLYVMQELLKIIRLAT